MRIPMVLKAGKSLFEVVHLGVLTRVGCMTRGCHCDCMWILLQSKTVVLYASRFVWV